MEKAENKKKIVGGRIKERNKKLQGRGLDVKRVVCERMRVARGKRLLFQKSRMSVKKD
jgi:uncharacterized protein (UPF0335 family)